MSTNNHTSDDEIIGNRHKFYNTIGHNESISTIPNSKSQYMPMEALEWEPLLTACVHQAIPKMVSIFELSHVLQALSILG